MYRTPESVQIIARPDKSQCSPATYIAAGAFVIVDQVLMRYCNIQKVPLTVP